MIPGAEVQDYLAPPRLGGRTAILLLVLLLVGMTGLALIPLNQHPVLPVVDGVMDTSRLAGQQHLVQKKPGISQSDYSGSLGEFLNPPTAKL
jgi:hypothetical protein